MKASYAWLRSLVPGLEASPSELAARLTGVGLEVEGVLEYGAASKQVRVAEVVRVERHPKRDKLTLVTVRAGAAEALSSGSTPHGAELTVVCGAPNVPAPGGRVVLAPLGAELPAAGLRIEPRAIGGVPSEGMLCSETELGLVSGSGPGPGILLLPPDAKVGATLAEAVPATHDWVLEVSVGANRPDALGHVGLAREIAALHRRPFEPPTPDAPARVAAGVTVAQLASVEIADTERCPHYGAAVVVDVTVGPSPDWLRYRLESLGVRALSNVVDITNLVLLELGHPMHAFDLDRLAAPGAIGRILVRRAHDGEPFRSLDGACRTLVGDDLVITDGESPVALAGVMGGENTEILASTRRVLLECAYFSPRGIRRSARRHGMQTESSFRFERGVDPEAVPDVLAHAAALITRLCGGKAVSGAILAGVAPAPRRQVVLRQAKLDALLGVSVPFGEAAEVLGRLGCEVALRESELSAVVPSHRPDLALEADLIEEVVRVWGIDRVPSSPRALVPAAGRSQPSIEDRARRAALELGLSEALTFGFVSRAQLEALGAPAPSVVLKNALTEERSVMRTTLLPGLLEALGRSRRRGVDDSRSFAVGRVFLAPRDGDVLPHEQLAFAAVLAGRRSAALGAHKTEVDVLDAKAVAVELCERVTRQRVRVARGAAPHLHPRGAGEVRLGAACVGRFGPIHPDVIERLELGGSCVAVEIDLDLLERAGRPAPQCRPIPQLPPVTRDLALLVRDEVTAGELAEAIVAAAGELCESVELFDVFAGKGVPDGHRSLAYHLVFRDPRAATAPEQARTLTDQEVDVLGEKVVGVVRERFAAVVRGA